ncbi:syntaxin binding protein 6 (amisyn), like [Aplochiton taeniatus]
MMNIQSAINKELFAPRDERMLVAVEVRRRKKKRVPFLPTGGTGDYATFICLSVTNKRPAQLLITKVKQFGGFPSFTRRSQWRVEQLRLVDGINPNKECPEFDLVFDSALDQWVASSAAEKCIFVQILYHACQTYWGGKEGNKTNVGKVRKASKSDPESQESQASPSDLGGPKGPRTLTRRKSLAPPRQTEFVNCQSKLTGDACTMNLVIYRCKVFFNRMKKRMVRSQGRPLVAETCEQIDLSLTCSLWCSVSPGVRGQRPPGGSLGSVMQKASMVLGERGEKLSRTEDKTVDLMYKAQQFSDTAHKLALKYS